jgi:hypothetical protein
MLSLLHNDFQIEPLDSVAVSVKRLNTLFAVQPLLTLICVNRVLPATQVQ